jgi:serine/threonine protein kinase
MVVMDYVDAQPKPPRNARGQIERVLTLLHANGYVVGDLRECNLLFGADGKDKFIDFD